MGRLGDPDWWWEYALDGVVGGVIGGLVTALAVWLTLRHERTLAREGTAAAALQQEVATARNMLVAVITAQVNVAKHALRTDDRDNAALHEAWLQVYDVWLPASALLSTRWPGARKQLGDQLGELQDQVSALQKGEDLTSPVADGLNNFSESAAAWMQDPSCFEDTTPAARRGRRS